MPWTLPTFLLPTGAYQEKRGKQSSKDALLGVKAGMARARTWGKVKHQLSKAQDLLAV